ncbi:hypothetical protein [uncultured Mucilaginibacter sp.]|uniref:hypothetical protein n=1 Tax=uncultured Mucilaginibacter sp. TaxID=797541 RepID=UPI0025F4B129|nr:hypothetical protein [uncultured Mucilaginibacter sp.]
MRKITAGDYTIDIFEDHAYSPNDSVHKYNQSYLETSGYQSHSIIGIKVYNLDTPLSSAVIGGSGGGTGIHETSFVSETDRLAICCTDTVFCLSIPDLSLLWKTKADTASCFEIFKYKTDYIIHGELEITRLAADGRILWQQSGADIFTRPGPEREDFIIAEDYILATDWDNRKYKFDFNGVDLS